MRKRVFGRKLKRTKNQRQALFRSLMNSLVLEGKIKTTEAKAKAIKGDVEKLVTRVKVKGDSARRILLSRLGDRRAVDKMIEEIGPKFTARSGGYTRILRMGARTKDGAEMVLMSWTEEVSKTSFKAPKRKTLKKTTGVSKKSAKETKKAIRKTKTKKNK